MAGELIDLLGPHPFALAIAVPVDLAIGDPVYRWHPIRLIGHGLRLIENLLRSVGADGYGGGISLFSVLGLAALGGVAGAVGASLALSVWGALVLHVFLLFSLPPPCGLFHPFWWGFPGGG